MFPELELWKINSVTSFAEFRSKKSTSNTRAESQQTKSKKIRDVFKGTKSTSSSKFDQSLIGFKNLPQVRDKRCSIPVKKS